MTLHTTDDVAAEALRYLHATNRMRTDDLEHLVRDTVEAIVAHHWMLPLREHHAAVDKAIEGALAGMPDDEYWRGHDDGKSEALAEIEALKSSAEQTPAA